MQGLFLQVEQAGLTQGEIRERIKEKQSHFHNLLTEEAALRIIAMENGVKLEKKIPEAGKLHSPKVGETASFVARILYTGEPKKFQRKTGESGMMASAGLAHLEGEATLVLWNRDCRDFLASGMGKNDLIVIRDALVKNLNPLELHSTLVTKIETPSASEVETGKKIPLAPENNVELEKLTTPMENIDVKCTVSKTGRVRKFNSNGRVGKICKLEVTQGQATATLVCWGEYASIAEQFQQMTEVNLQNLTAKLNKLTSQVELHTTGTSQLISKNTIQKPIQGQKPLSALGDGDSAVVEVEIKKLLEIKAISMCSKCRTSLKIGLEKCHCGGEPEQTIVAEAEITGNGTEMRCSFYDRRALHLLGMKSIAPDIAEVITKLKADELKGKKFKLNVAVKQNHFLNALSATCKEFP